MAEVLDTTQQIVLSVRMRGDEKGPQTGDVVLGGNIYQNFSEDENYDKFEAVIYNGDIYRSIDDVEKGPWNPDQWECLTNITMRISDFIPFHRYQKDEVILVDGHLYRAKDDMTTGTDFDETEWDAIDSVNTILRNFEEKSDYSQYEIVAKDGKLFRAKNQFVSGTTFDISNWEAIADIQIDEFKPNTDYLRGNLCIADGKLYRANQDFTSGTVFQPAYWDVINSSGIGTFNSNTYYPVNSTIYVDGKIYVAKQDFTSTTSFNPADWEAASETTADNYANGTTYEKNKIIYYNGSMYRARQDFVSGTSFNSDDWELISSATTTDFKPNFSYLKGTIIYHDGVLWISKRDFVSGTSFDANDWTVLTQTEQETYDSWKTTGTTVHLTDLDEKFINTTNSNVILENKLNASESSIITQATHSNATIKAKTDEASLKLSNNDANLTLTQDSILAQKGSTKFEVDVNNATVNMSTNIKNAFGSQIATMSTTQKGTAKSDGKTTRVSSDVLSAYPIVDIYTPGHTYKQYELCTYDGNVYQANEDFTASTWSISDWTPIKEIVRTYEANKAFSIGDLILVNNQLYYCNTAITSAPASRNAAHWTKIKINANDVVLNTLGNRIATSSDLETSINYLDADLTITVHPLDGATEYRITTQAAGSTPPAAESGKTIICLYTE